MQKYISNIGNILGLRKFMELYLLKRGKWWYNSIIDSF